MSFNPIFYPISICMSGQKNTTLQNAPPPRSANLCPDVSSTSLLISPFNVPSLSWRRATRHQHTPPLLPLSRAAVPCRRHLACHHRTSPPHAMLCRRRQVRLCRQEERRQELCLQVEMQHWQMQNQQNVMAMIMMSMKFQMMVS